MKTPKNLDPRFLQDGMGKPSMMRLISYQGAVTGRRVLYAGVAILCAEIFYFQSGTSFGLAVAGIGAGLFGVGEIAKSSQSKNEK